MWGRFGQEVLDMVGCQASGWRDPVAIRWRTRTKGYNLCGFVLEIGGEGLRLASSCAHEIGKQHVALPTMFGKQYVAYRA